MRFRIFDWNTPWFWVVAFYRRKTYSRARFDFTIFSPQRSRRWWFHALRWEHEPEMGAGEATVCPGEDMRECGPQVAKG